jgi:hypothetical protein
MCFKWKIEGFSLVDPREAMTTLMCTSGWVLAMELGEVNFKTWRSLQNVATRFTLGTNLWASFD